MKSPPYLNMLRSQDAFVLCVPERSSVNLILLSEIDLIVLGNTVRLYNVFFHLSKYYSLHTTRGAIVGGNVGSSEQVKAKRFFVCKVFAICI